MTMVNIYKIKIAIQSIARWDNTIHTDIFDFITAGLVCIKARTREISEGENIKWYLSFLVFQFLFIRYTQQ